MERHDLQSRIAGDPEMRLTSFTDFGLRALMRMAGAPDQVFSTTELADEFEISRHHLTKVMSALAAGGFVTTRRGGGGGAKLARPAEEIRLGEVVQVLEADQSLVECFAASGNSCNLTPHCRLRGKLAAAETAFLAALNTSTLADCAYAGAEG